MTAIRAFFALGVSFPQQHQLAQLTQAMAFEQEACASMRWVPCENYHITLAFLGGIDSRDLPELNDVVQQLTPQFSAMLLCFNTITWFPKPERPKILVALPRPVDALKQLQLKLSHSLKELDYYQQSTPFNPHITLARASKKQKVDTQSADYFQGRAIDITLSFNEVALFSSSPGVEAPVYTSLFTQQLGV